MRRLEPSPATAITWVRLDTEFVAGEELLPAVRLAMAADMIPSASAVLGFGSFLSVNPDLSVTLHRLPEGEWIGSRAAVRIARDGWGQTEARLFDERGAVGTAVKSLLIDER